MSVSALNNFPSSGALIIVVIIASSTILGAISYGYSTSSANLISKNAIDTIHSNAQVSAHDIAEMLENRILDIQSNIKIISRAPLVQSSQVDAVHILFSTSESETSDIADSYFWIDQDGKLLWASSFENATLRGQFAGSDTSFRDYYQIPKQTLQPYITKVIKSTDGIPRLFVTQPILSTDNQPPVFRGVIVASINVSTLGKFLESQLAPQFNSTIGMLDKEGQILYSTDASAIGQDVFGQEFQSKLPDDLKDAFNNFLRTSLKGEAGFEDITYQGNSGTLAYQPVVLGKDTWGVMYVVTPHSFATTVQTAIDSQRSLSIITDIAIGGVAIGLVILVLRWNNDLGRLVKKRTKELETKTEQLETKSEELRQSNESLLTSNKKLEQAYDDLLVHDKMQREFINVAAHELRTPIQPILGLAELAEENANNSGDMIQLQKEDLAILFRNAKRLERLSSDILEVARIESGKLKLSLEEFDLCVKIRNVVNDIKMGILSDKGSGKVDIVIAAPEEKILIQADKAKIYEVLSNLIINALKFTKEGSIVITTESRQAAADHDGKSASEAIVSIKDTGEGISSEIMPRLFSKFVSSDTKGGTGLGLFISKNIIEAHGGRIWAENNKNGKGATFGFSLPINSQVNEKITRQLPTKT